jgi:hypothetical protein
VSFSTEEEAAKLKLFVEKNPVYAEYVKRMKLRGHAFGLRNMRKFDISQIETGLETPKEWGITDADLLPPTVLDNDITEDRDRVKALGEVFTPTSLVNFVLDLVEKYDSSAFTDTSNTFIDSMCGDGQFLVGIKNKGVCASKIYGIDLTQSNIDNSLRRTRGSASNIVCQDSLGSTFTNLYYDDEVKAKAKEDHLNNLFTVE